MAPALLMQHWGRFAGLEREGETKRPKGEAVASPSGLFSM